MLHDLRERGVNITLLPFQPCEALAQCRKFGRRLLALDGDDVGEQVAQAVALFAERGADNLDHAVTLGGERTGDDLDHKITFFDEVLSDHAAHRADEAAIHLCDRVRVRDDVKTPRLLITRCRLVVATAHSPIERFGIARAFDALGLGVLLSRAFQITANRFEISTSAFAFDLVHCRHHDAPATN
jgi:hypothetical protein